MTASADRPQVWHQLCFNADPNDESAVPVWVDCTEMVRRITMNRRGAQYELAQSQAADPKIYFRDPDEILNPENVSSPQYPFVEPYRQELSQAMWPNPEAPGGLGSSINLLNSDRWKPNNDVAADPSFESYANGAALPGWLASVGATVPTVTTTTPHQGTKALTYTVAATTTRQGVSWDVACVPGEQYTSSAYVRQSSASTQCLLVDGQNLAYAWFRTTAANSWPTADSGQTWTVSGGAGATDFSASAQVAYQSNGTTNSFRTSSLDAGTADQDVRVECMLSIASATGASAAHWVCARETDGNNHYIARLMLTTSSTVTLQIDKRVAGVLSAVVAAVDIDTSHTGGEWYRVRFQTYGPVVRAKAWLASQAEPSAWNVSGTDTSLTTGNLVALRSRLETGNTNSLPVIFAWRNFMTTGMLSSTTTTTTGSYVRLTRTWTATQPKHTIQLSTVGTAVAGTVLVDALQHEIGASAGTFTTDGPVIYPWQRLYIERWPRGYEAGGFVGVTDAPAVDGFAALNAITVNSEYDAAVLASRPAYFWPLNGGANTAQALEVSGNGGPPLEPFASKYGPGIAPIFGTQIGIPGAAGATGVRFEPLVAGGAAFGEGTILSLGRRPDVPGIVFPTDYGSTVWSASIACWAQINIASVDSTHTIAAPFGDSSPNPTSPIAITAASFTSPFNVVDFHVTTQGPGAGATATASALDQSDGLHLIVGTVTQTAGGNTVVSIYFDGALAATTTVTTASLGGIYTSEATFVNVGGNTNGGVMVDGVVAKVSLWQRALSAAEVTTLWDAGLGNVGETTGQRLERHLSDGRYAGERRISTTYTTLGPPSVAGVDGLTDAQNLTLAEAGRLWCAPDGALVLESRMDRWLRYSTVVTVFGEDSAAGEIPYGPGIQFDFDPMFVYADVRITRNNGSQAQGGLAADVAAVARKYFPRSYAIGADFETDIQAQYYADYVFYTHDAPLMRVSVITITPAANPSLWPVALSLEIGQRVTVKRRAKAANSGAGLTMSADYFIESVIIHEIDFDKWDFRVSFLLSPIGTVPGPTFQPWILENATYGVLDSTTILGW